MKDLREENGCIHFTELLQVADNNRQGQQDIRVERFQRSSASMNSCAAVAERWRPAAPSRGKSTGSRGLTASWGRPAMAI